MARGYTVAEIAIDRTLSVYGLLGRLNSTQQTLIKHRRTMNAISYEIENLVILDGVRGRVFSSFQRMSRFLPQVRRYQQIAERAESVYVMGIMDTVPPPIPNIHYIPLPADAQLVKEWFVILDSPEYSCTLATEEVSRPNATDAQRMFKGIWTFNQEMTTILQEWLSSLFNAREMEIDPSLRDPQRQIALMTEVQARLKLRGEREIKRAQQSAMELQEEIEAVFKASL